MRRAFMYVRRASSQRPSSSEVRVSPIWRAASDIGRPVRQVGILRLNGIPQPRRVTGGCGGKLAELGRRPRIVGLVPPSAGHVICVYPATLRQPDLRFQGRDACKAWALF